MSTAPEIFLVFLAEYEWRDRRLAHETRVRRWTDPHQARAARGEKHPVYDFLFSYYAFRPAWLRRWHPGPDVVLTGAAARDFLHWPEYRGIGFSSPNTSDFPLEKLEAIRRTATRFVSEITRAPGFTVSENDAVHSGGVALDVAALRPQRRKFVLWLRDLLIGMRERPAFFGCFGLHEWAMVYRQTVDEVRHNAHPLRYPAEELAHIVERSAICCSHFDAFRFFTAPARPLNKLQPAREDSARLEQRGCLHANMDLYKWAFKLAPFTPSELVADCFELARDIREIDMRASPYDLRALGFEPIAIETPEGRAEYERHQRAFALRGEPLRERLIALCVRLLAD
jgi:hypothetical protein